MIKLVPRMEMPIPSSTCGVHYSVYHHGGGKPTQRQGPPEKDPGNSAGRLLHGCGASASLLPRSKGNLTPRTIILEYKMLTFTDI